MTGPQNLPGCKRRFSATLTLLSALMVSTGLTGCVVIGGSSRGGFFLWPGSLGLILIVVLFMLLSRRR